MASRFLRLIPTWLVFSFLLTGCASMDWMPGYLEAKVRIDSRYRGQMASLKYKRVRGQISSAYYQRRSNALEAQWDRELRVAKSRAQGTRVASSRSSSGRSRSRSGGSGGRDDSTPTPSREDGSSSGGHDIHVPLDTGAELRGGRSSGGGRLD